jgi:hypothetical protein
MTKSNLVDIAVTLHHETEKAVLVSDSGERATAVWVPKAACEIERRGKVWILTLPERVARDKGFIRGGRAKGARAFISKHGGCHERDRARRVRGGWDFSRLHAGLLRGRRNTGRASRSKRLDGANGRWLRTRAARQRRV